MASDFLKNEQTPHFRCSDIQKWNGMGYHYLNVRINCINDASISCENFVKFGPVITELTELICEHQVRRGQKTGVFPRISPDILD